MLQRTSALKTRTYKIISNDNILTLSDNGGVNRGSDDPYKTINGRAKAAAICIKPESFDTTRFANDIKSIASANDVFPVKSKYKHSV